MSELKVTYWFDETSSADESLWIVDIDDGITSRTTLSTHSTKQEAEIEAKSQAATRGLQCVCLNSFGIETK